MYLAIDIGGTKTLLAVFNTSGKIVFEHAGEGQYDEMEQLVKKLLDHNS